MGNERPTRGVRSRSHGPDGLTDKARLIAFALDSGLDAETAYYMACPNTKASTETARREVDRIKNKPAVKDFLDRLLARKLARHDALQDEILAELRRLAFGDPRTIVSWNESGMQLRDSEELTAAEARQVAEVSRTVSEAGGTTRVKTIDRLTALDKLIRILGMYAAEKKEIAGPNGGPINFLDMSDVEREQRMLRILRGADTEPES